MPGRRTTIVVAAIPKSACKAVIDQASVSAADPLQRGYPAPPLAPTNGRLYDAWYHKKVVLKGVSWFGFNNEQGMVDGLWAGGSSAATDFQAVVYQLKLLGEWLKLP